MLRSFGSWTPFKIRLGENAAMLSAAIPEDDDYSTVAITTHHIQTLFSPNRR